MTATTVSVADLRQALRAIVPFTDPTGFEVMECVHLEAAHNNLVATASDRYVLGHIRMLAAGDPLPITLLPRRDAKHIRHALSDMPADEVASVRRIRKLDGPDFLEVATKSRVIRVRVLGEGVKPPDLRHPFSKIDLLPPDLTAPVNLPPELVRPFAKAAKALGLADARWTFYGPKQPVRVEIGRTFVGLVMPRSFPAGSVAEPVPVGLVTA